ncbi:membrane protein insertion efficiency factor YidD [Sulfurovum sp.]|uniref:membrane protein insertion efficiency factor YidD n=1 Tax=Sulfurovum sp. TaxID=1969726 RepID=UPI0025F24789|nr:membrane protein insertion efficiency factor YidD [Sulfurovum sp.]
MNIKNFYLAPIKGYQYISKMLPANCRYYPTCSEYAKWQFEFNAPHKALWESSLRILRCNQLFDGGIDYPVIHYTPPKLPALRKSKAFYGKIKILYWLVPKNETQFYVLKDFDGTYTPGTT